MTEGERRERMREELIGDPLALCVLVSIPPHRSLGGPRPSVSAELLARDIDVVDGLACSVAEVLAAAERSAAVGWPLNINRRCRRISWQYNTPRSWHVAVLRDLIKWRMPRRVPGQTVPRSPGQYGGMP